MGELAIPLLGFFWLDWDLYFILLFYLLDVCATEVFYQLKLAKIITFQKTAPSFFQRISTVILVLFIGVFAHIMIYRLYPDIAFFDAFIDFLTYEEEGIPIAQGYLLLPLIIFGNYQQYKMFFLLPNRFRTIPLTTLVTSRRNALIAAYVGITLTTSIVYFIDVPEVIILIAFVAGKLWFDLKRSVL